ncbi:thioredoxin [Leucobacter allii]|uniref:Thioredoxin n=1 Tax=Leucobacter allii TaxID=2932247 RepID=A0ABY4FM59_9MICO|nr:thioredoxin [Leucobacter allii]UOQ57363.1 thioredoxin [Leucobacter allii]
MTLVTDVTDATFAEAVLQAEKPVIVDFWAEWCGPCRRLSPVLEQLAVEYADRVDVVKVNVDENREVAGRYRIISIPAVLVFAGGEVAATVRGAQPKPVLEREFARFLGAEE